jgi:GNAT superfamily N-acetyltransferase
VNIRDATAADAAAACEVLRASISELCVADHHNDPSMLLAAEDDVVLAVGAVRNDGEITLNYVSPAARFRGVSSALLAALETRAKERGNTHCKLLSTETAHRFYLNRGYVGRGVPQHKFGTSSSYPMSKSI